MRPPRLITSLLVFAVLAVGCSDDTSTQPDKDQGVDQSQVIGDSALPDGPAPDTQDPCGNGVLDPQEICDDQELGGKTCKTEGFDRGALACKADCTLDTSACVHDNCGNGAVDGNEDCDAADLNGKTCKSEGFDGGTLACASNCAFDVGGCYRCGDGKKAGPEACDGKDFGGKTCKTEGFESGSLTCSKSCTAISTAGCGRCGDGKVNQGTEQCDGADLAGETCKTQGFSAGNLGCSATCTFDTGSCTGSSGKTLTKFFFMHHSVGDSVISGGNMRAQIASYNQSNGTSFELWDQMLYGTDINDAQGSQIASGGYDVGKSGITTTPTDWRNFWTATSGPLKTQRDQLLSKHEVVAFKSCYLAIEPGSADFELSSAAALADWKASYTKIRNFFDTRKDRLFVVMTVPPTVASASNAQVAQRARDFANWLCSPAFLSGHPNVVCYDLFGKLANSSNMLKTSYQTDPWDSHPNAAAQTMLGSDLTTFMINAAKAYKATP